MTFDEIKNYPMLPEQAKCHIVALSVHSKQMERKLNHLDQMINEQIEIGTKESIAKSQELFHSKQKRIKLIELMRDEVERLNKVFGDIRNEQGNN